MIWWSEKSVLGLEVGWWKGAIRAFSFLRKKDLPGFWILYQWVRVSGSLFPIYTYTEQLFCCTTTTVVRRILRILLPTTTHGSWPPYGERIVARRRPPARIRESNQHTRDPSSHQRRAFQKGEEPQINFPTPTDGCCSVSLAAVWRVNLPKGRWIC